MHILFTQAFVAATSIPSAAAQALSAAEATEFGELMPIRRRRANTTFAPKAAAPHGHALHASHRRKARHAPLSDIKELPVGEEPEPEQTPK